MPARRSSALAATDPTLSRRHAAGAPSARGLLFTLLGEFVLPGGGTAWTSAVLAAFARLGIEEKATRQALTRTAASGWLDAEKVGRRTRWRLTGSARRMLTVGAERIYSFTGPTEDWDGRWLLVYVRIPDSDRRAKHVVRSRLSWAGFGSLGAGLWISPHPDREAEAIGVLTEARVAQDAHVFVASRSGLADVRIMVADAWDLTAIEEQYGQFIEEFRVTAPPDVLAANFGMPAETFSKIFMHDLWIFQSSLPGPLAADQDAVKSPNGPPPNPFTYSLAGGPVAKQTKGGMAQIADSHNFKAAATIAAALVTVHPGGMREMHWHPNADEWQYYLKGKGRMTVFNTGPNAMTMDFNAGDIGYVKKNLGHYVENVGDTDLVFIAVFRAPEYQEISLSNWLTHTPPALVAQHLNIDEATIAKWPDDGPGIMPKA